MGAISVPDRRALRTITILAVSVVVFFSLRQLLMGSVSHIPLVDTGDCEPNDYQAELKDIREAREDIQTIDRQLETTYDPQARATLLTNRGYLQAFLQHLLNTHGHCSHDGKFH